MLYSEYISALETGDAIKMVLEATKKNIVQKGTIEPEHLLVGLVSSNTFVSTMICKYFENTKELLVSRLKTELLPQFDYLNKKRFLYLSNYTEEIIDPLCFNDESSNITYFTMTINILDYFICKGYRTLLDRDIIFVKDVFSEFLKYENELFKAYNPSVYIITDEYSEDEDEDEDEVEEDSNTQSMSAITVKKDTTHKSQKIDEIKIQNCTDLTFMYRNVKNTLIGQKNIISKATYALKSTIKASPVLIGKPGVGKTAIVHAMANMMANDPSYSLYGYHILELNLSSCVSGTKYRGDFEKKMQDTLNAIVSRKDIIVFVDEVHQIIGSGSTDKDSPDISTYIKSYLLNYNMKIIGTSTFDEYRIIEKNSALKRRFTPITVNEPTTNEVFQILQELDKTIAKESCMYPANYATLKHIIYLCSKYLLNMNFPDKAIDLLEAVFIYVRENSLGKITKKHVEKVFTSRYSIPVSVFSKNQIDKYLCLEKRLSNEIFGQNEVIKKILNSVKVKLLGISDATRPTSFLFTGPTGVGKTEIAKLIGEEIFDNNILTIDMTEFKDEASISKLIGAPPGYVGYNEPGLFEKVRRFPYSLILFDEAEKAHPKVLHILMQILEYGRVTDSKGVVIDFRNTIIILTTNIKSNMSTVGFSSTNDYGYTITAVEKEFPPELYNRIDNVFAFNVLSEESAIKITEKFLTVIKNRIKENLNIYVDFSTDSISYISKKAFNPKYGARAVKRYIENELLTIISDQIIKVRDKKQLMISLSNEEVIIS